VERYYPEDDNLKTGTIVINAHISNGPFQQVIEVSRSASLINLIYDPLQDCYVEIESEDGTTRSFLEEKPGNYKAMLWPDFLETGKSYRIHVITPDGNEYESDFEKLRPVPEIDSIYYMRETVSYEAPADSLPGIRFYLDFTYDREDYEFLRWELTETYEYHNHEMKGFILSYGSIFAQPLTDTNNYRICYITNELPEIYSMSLKNLEKGSYINKLLNIVPNIRQEQKLHHEYSLLVRQYSISREAFFYWDELMKATQEMGGLFDRQPALLISNICNLNDENEKVLGFFSMSGETERRAIARDIEGIDRRPYKWDCVPVDKEIGGTPNKKDYPLYFASRWIDGILWHGMVKRHCVDCRAYKNSSHIKPEYW